MDFPVKIRIGTKHVGDLGETLLLSHYNPPEAVTDVLRKYLRDIAPEWVAVDDIDFSMNDESKLFIVNVDGEQMKWESDGEITANYRLSWVEYPDKSRKVRVYAVGVYIPSRN